MQPSSRMAYARTACRIQSLFKVKQRLGLQHVSQDYSNLQGRVNQKVSEGISITWMCRFILKVLKKHILFDTTQGVIAEMSFVDYKWYSHMILKFSGKLIIPQFQPNRQCLEAYHFWNIWGRTEDGAKQQHSWTVENTLKGSSGSSYILNKPKPSCCRLSMNCLKMTV